MADYLLTNARAVVKLDEGLAPRDVAALADAGLTAYHAVRKAAPRLVPGAQVVVVGAGGLGHIGIQTLVALTQAHITVVDRSAEALELATRLGAHDTVRSDGPGDGEQLIRQVNDSTDGGAHVVFDFVAEQGMEKLGPRMLRPRGDYYVIGYGGELELATIDIISREINVIGNLVGTYLDLVELMTLTAQGKVTLETSVYDLADFATAISDLEQGRLVGRGILVP